MITRDYRQLSVAALLLASLSLASCATTDYVDEKVAAVQTQVTAHDGRIGALEGKASANEAAIAKLAAGKFNYAKIAEETFL
ncbi:MAG: hypothetical protein EOP61_27850 [Sphingomonadales bacterium]|nr:MAG: hypothetical protein EOP61_27850 [Sphingomonadales bacterium]